jgi:hypothetical protein
MKQGRVDKFSAEALGMHCASALSIIGPYRQSPKEGEEEIKKKEGFGV